MKRIWIIENEVQVAVVAEELASYMLAYGEPQINRLSTPHIALEILSRDDSDARAHKGTDASRAKRAVALALQMHGISAGRELEQQKRRYLRGEERSEFIRWSNALFADGETLCSYQS